MQRAVVITMLLWLCALGLGAWALAQLPLASIAQSITSLTRADWLLWLLLNVFVIAVLNWRWQQLGAAFNSPLRFWPLLCIRQAGQTLSFITPGPQFGGEPLQLYWLYRYGIPLRKALLSLGLDRFYELWINFSILLFAVLILLSSNHGSDDGSGLISDWKNAIIPLLVFLSLMLILAWILIRQPQWFYRRLERIALRWQHNHRLSNIHEHWQQLGDDLRLALRTQKRRMLVAILLSLFGWIGLLGELWLLLELVGVQPRLHSFLLILIAMRMALLLPMPGGVGTLEASVLWSFHSLNLPASAAASLIALMRLRDAVILVVGFFCLGKIKTVCGMPPSKLHSPRA